MSLNGLLKLSLNTMQIFLVELEEKNIGLVPIIGTIVILIFYLQNSSPGENQYGPNPKEEVNIN